VLFHGPGGLDGAKCESSKSSKVLKNEGHREEEKGVRRMPEKFIKNSQKKRNQIGGFVVLLRLIHSE
jgi:hypothetical protein